MARRRSAGPIAAPSGVTRPSALANIDAVIVGGGQIMLGAMRPIDGVAVAHDGHNTLAMLRRRPDETVQQLLERLDTAIGTALAGGRRVDEINRSSDERYVPQPGGSVKTASK